MPLIRERLENKSQTGQKMYWLVNQFAADIGNYAQMPLNRYFDFVRKIPYRRDKKGEEWVVRPGLLLKEFPYMDCKKKGTLIGAWLRMNGIPFRFIGASELPSGRIHHVFPQAMINGEWLNVDATYPHYKLFAHKPRLTRAEILKP